LPKELDLHPLKSTQKPVGGRTPPGAIGTTCWTLRAPRGCCEAWRGISCRCQGAGLPVSGAEASGRGVFLPASLLRFRGRGSAVSSFLLLCFGAGVGEPRCLPSCFSASVPGSGNRGVFLPASLLRCRGFIRKGLFSVTHSRLLVYYTSSLSLSYTLRALCVTLHFHQTAPAIGEAGFNTLKPHANMLQDYA
jgi:hypothetical protein